MFSKTICFVLVYTAIMLCAFSPPKDVRLVLIGVAMGHTEQPLSSVTVQLKDMATQKTQIFVTNLDGHFYFKLQGDKNYQISLLGVNNRLLEVKSLSTVNKVNPEIIHLILKDSSIVGNSIIANRAVYTTLSQPLRANANPK